MMGGVRTRLVCAHYFGGSARSWQPLASALGEGFDCVAPDLPGFGGTPPASAEPSLDGYADWLEGLAGAGPWIAVGHSMGAKIALAAAARGSPNLAAVILIAPSPPTPEPMTEDDRRKTIARFGDRTASWDHFRDITDHSLPVDVLARCVEDEARVALSAWLWWMERGSRDDISTRTTGLDLPALVIAGDRDRVLGSDTPAAVAKNLARATETVIPGGGHLVPLEKPAAAAAAIVAFIGGLAGSDRP